MNDNIKFADVERFYRSLISLGDIFIVDDSGYIVNKADDNDSPVIITDGNKVRRVRLLREAMTDNECVIINPLSESSSDTMDTKWLYTLLAMGLTRRVVVIMRDLHTMVVSGGAEFSASAMEFASRHSDFDDKAFAHFEHLSKKMLNFMNVWFVRKSKEARFRCSVYDPETRIEYPTITKKSWKAITSVMNEILGLDRVSDLDEANQVIIDTFSFKSDMITTPRLHAVLNVYKELYTRLTPYLKMCGDDNNDDFIPNVSELSGHIDNLEAYYDKIKWFTSANTIKPSMQTSPLVNPIHNTTTIPGPSQPTKWSPTPECPDGRYTQQIHQPMFQPQQPIMPSHGFAGFGNRPVQFGYNPPQTAFAGFGCTNPPNMMNVGGYLNLR